MVDIATMPLEITAEAAILAAYGEEIDRIIERLSRGFSVMVECEKSLTMDLYIVIRNRFRRTPALGLALQLCSGHSALQAEMPMTLMQGILTELKTAVFNGGAEENKVLVLPHLDVLTTTTRSGLNLEAREAIVTMFENPRIRFLGFKDPQFEVPEVLANAFSECISLIGLKRSALPSLVTQREARKFGVRDFNPFALFKYVSGLNAIRFRQIMKVCEGRMDFDPANPGTGDAILQDIRRMTTTADVDVPNVSLENDIGGYANVKKQIREDILDLLSYKDGLTNAAEIKRIEEIVPKGMVFLGPPGTGKTFFAKAMATALNATVIIVSGPELKSKWVGESLPYEEPVLAVINGVAGMVPIGELVEDHSEDVVEVWTVNDQGKSSLAPVSGFLRHEGPPWVDVITTESGRSVTVTGGHSLFVRQNDGLAEVLAEDVIIGQTRIAMAHRLEAPETCKVIDLLNLLRDCDDVFVQGAEAMLRRLPPSNLMTCRDSNPCTVSQYLDTSTHHRPLPLTEFFRLTSGMEIDRENLTLYTWHRKKNMPTLLPLTEGFGEFLGWWVAEGSISPRGDGVRLSVNAKEVTHILGIVEPLFGTATVYNVPNSRGSDVIVNNALLARILIAMGLKTGSHKQEVPPCMFLAPKPVVAAFLRGYFTGDGHFTGKYIEATSISKTLADGVATLLLYFGIGCRHRIKQEKNSVTPAHRIRFLWSKYLRVFADEIGFADGEKQQRLRAYVDGMTFQRSSQTPEQHVMNDVVWERVVDRKRLSYERPHVYDISVPGTERFVAGPGNTIVHNSEANLRGMFAQARASAPSIIVFDEIDSFATARGTYTGSGVEHSMVNQLLTEMDGFRKEEQVFIVGTTNFAESLDPALLRPGRFELQIEIPYPDAVSRRAICEIYKNKFELDIADDVMEQLVELTGHHVDDKRTVRYSGDHIYAIFRRMLRDGMRRKTRLMTLDDVHRAMDKKANKARKPLTTEEERVVAYHECGHAFVSQRQGTRTRVNKISIASDMEDALGYVERVLMDSGYIQHRKHLIAEISTLLAGRAAEEIFIGEVSGGASDDLQKSTRLVRAMIEELGMGKSLGNRVVAGRQGYGENAFRDNISQALAKEIDDEISQVLDECYTLAKTTIEGEREVFEKLVATLLEKKVLNGDDLTALIGA